jgi:restriction system protein
MAVPDFQTLMLPVLLEYADGQERKSSDVRDIACRKLGLSAADMAERLPSSPQTRIANRIAWAHSYLKQAGILESPRRGHYQITSRGRELLKSPPSRINIEFLERYPDFLEFRQRKNARSEEAHGATATEGSGNGASPTELTPDEQIKSGYANYRANLAVQLLDRVRKASPAFFEELVIEVLVAMGYGGSHDDAAKVVGRSGDGGIDGVIKQDRLGLENIYVQAKRWEATVGRPTIQQFAGALQGQRANKGVLITTSDFSREAEDYAKNLQNTIVLVSGEELAELMIDYGVGVNDGETIKLKKLDEDYFAEE